MPGDIYRKGKPGDPLNIPAALFNKLVEQAHGLDFKQRGGDVSFTQHQHGIVKIQNTSGAVVDRFGVLGLDGPIITPTAKLSEFQRQVTFKGITPDADEHKGKFAVLLEPLGIDKIGLGVISGPVSVRVTGDLQHFAEIIDGDRTKLECNATGSARVLYAEAGSAERWATVRIGHPASEASFLVRLTGKDYSEEWIQYSGTAVQDGVPELTFTDLNLEFGPNDNPIYDVNNVDHPVPVIVRVRKGNGDYYLIEENPRNEVVRKTTTTPDADGFFSGFLQQWDQVNEGWVDTEAILIRDANLDP